MHVWDLLMCSQDCKFVNEFIRIYTYSFLLEMMSNFEKYI